MPHKGLPIAFRFLSILAVTLWVSGAWAANNSNLRVLHNFASGSDGQYPFGGLIRDAAGNLYGTTTYGGDNQVGAVFEVTPAVGGGWTEKVLYSFHDGTGDGSSPYGGLVMDDAGNLYGTTSGGGTYLQGTVFKLSPNESGDWTETVLYSFGNGSGTTPYAGLIRDAAGNLYGTTGYGGDNQVGTAFELSPAVGGEWTESVLHSFGSGTDGYYPLAGLILDSAGNLYGATEFGGVHDCHDAQDTGCGIVFKLAPDGAGEWTETVLHDFENNGMDGSEPITPLTMDAAGNLYGTTKLGGTFLNYGTVFELTSAADGSWTETVLYSFSGAPDGEGPSSPVIFDAVGNLYGATEDGGVFGTAFKLTRNVGGGWTETVLYRFCSENDCTDGSLPFGSLVLDAAGNLFGTTQMGGANQCTLYYPQCGTVFKLRAAPPCAECSNSF